MTTYNLLKRKIEVLTEFKRRAVSSDVTVARGHRYLHVCGFKTHCTEA